MVGLDPEKLRNQCCNGARNMTGKIKGAGPQIQRHYSKEIPFWCVAPQLNRCIMQSCSVQTVKNMMHTANQVVRLFEFSSARPKKLEEIIERSEEINSQNKISRNFVRQDGWNVMML